MNVLNVLIFSALTTSALFAFEIKDITNKEEVTYEDQRSEEATKADIAKKIFEAQIEEEAKIAALSVHERIRSVEERYLDRFVNEIMQAPENRGSFGPRSLKCVKVQDPTIPNGLGFKVKINFGPSLQDIAACKEQNKGTFALVLFLFDGARQGILPFEFENKPSAFQVGLFIDEIEELILLNPILNLEYLKKMIKTFREEAEKLEATLEDKGNGSW